MESSEQQNDNVVDEHFNYRRKNGVYDCLEVLNGLMMDGIRTLCDADFGLMDSVEL